MRLLMLLCILLTGLPAQAEQAKSWWEQRQQRRPELYFPHNAHEQALEDAGLSCLACHPFNATRLSDPVQVQALTRIANEPLEAICHSCHVQDRSAPGQCRLCHPDPQRIWPRDHDFDYVERHANTARMDEQACRQCHLDLQDCIACHFQRDASQQRGHRLGYRLSHGLDARMDAATCGRCHNPSYCFDCHRNITP